MKCKILAKAGEMFLNYGFKSVTMDDIANKMGISKKTIYAHFKNKTKLVEETTLSIFELISSGINCICELKQNPIEELFAIKKFIMDNLNDEKSSPHYQLQKYYPTISHTLKIKQLEIMKESVTDNLKRGIAQKLYRNDLNLEFISRIYFTGMFGLKDEETFPKPEYNQNDLMESYLNYHIRAIATEKGLQTLQNVLSKNEK